MQFFIYMTTIEKSMHVIHHLMRQNVSQLRRLWMAKINRKERIKFFHSALPY